MKLRIPFSGRQFVFFLAVAALIGAGVVAYQTVLLPKSVHEAITIFFSHYEEDLLLIGLLSLLVVFTLGTSWTRRRRELENVLEGVQQERPGRDANIAGEELTRVIETRIGAQERMPEPDKVRDRLRDVLIATYRRELGSTEAAVEQVDAGKWTSDPIATAYLSDQDKLDYPLLHRLYRWLYPGQAFGRELTRALAAVEEVCENRYVSYEQPTERWRWGRSVIDRVRSLIAAASNRE